jgi:hypothetical protein
MKSITACLLAAGIALMTATPAIATPAPAADHGQRASAAGIGSFVTRSLITQTLRLAERRPPTARNLSFQRNLNGLKRFQRDYDRYRSLRKRERDFCYLAQAIFGYPRRYYYYGGYVWSYPYDDCAEYLD